MYIAVVPQRPRKHPWCAGAALRCVGRSVVTARHKSCAQKAAHLRFVNVVGKNCGAFRPEKSHLSGWLVSPRLLGDLHVAHPVGG